MSEEYNNATHWVSLVIDSDRPINIENPLLSSIFWFGTLPNIALIGAISIYITGPSFWEFAPAFFQPNQIPSDFLIAGVFAGLWLNIGPYLIWYYDERVMPTFFSELSDIVQNKNTIDDISERYILLFSKHYWVPTLIWTLLLVGLFFNAQSFLVTEGIFEVGDAFYFGSLFFVIYLGVFTGIGFMGVVTTILAIREISKVPLKIDPYHPDGLGGLSIFGYYAIRTTLTFSTGSLLIPLTFIFVRAETADLIIYFVGFAYTGTIALSFIYPTYKINKQAQNIRSQRLDEIREEYELAKSQMEEIGDVTNQLGNRKHHSSLRDSINDDQLPRVTELVGQLEIQRIRSEYEDYQRVRLYPFQIDIIIKLVSSILLPLIFVLIDHYLGIIF